MSMGAIKQGAGSLLGLVNPQCRFDRAVFILGHMRCGSTALSHVLCGHPSVSGYGEAHIRYDSQAALGVLALNQWRRGAWKPRARHLFDKILHSRYDAAADPAFFRARAIFLIREPHESILSIRKLFAALHSDEYADDESAADYYEKRLMQLALLWERFPIRHRIGISYSNMTENPDSVLQLVSSILDLNPPLTNHYNRPETMMARGAGDPLSSHKFNGIVASSQSSTLTGSLRQLDLRTGRTVELEQLYRAVCGLFS